MTDCSRNCWIFAALMGVIVLILAMAPGGAGFFAGLILAIVTGLLLGGLLVMMFCGGASDRSDMTTLGLSEPSDRRVNFTAPQAGAGDGRSNTVAVGDVDRAARQAAVQPVIQVAPAGASSDPKRAATFEPSAARRAAEEQAEEKAASSVIRMGAPQGASSDPSRAVTFAAHDGAQAGQAASRSSKTREATPRESGADAAPAGEPRQARAKSAADVTAEAKQQPAQVGRAQAAGDSAARGAAVDASASSIDARARASTVNAPAAKTKKLADNAVKAPDSASSSTTGASSPRQAASGAPAKTARQDKDGAPPKKRKADVEDSSGAPDELGRIYGVGPKLTEWLHENGIQRFAQIAAWSPEDVVAWAARLDRDGGRIERDDWVGQARILAAGGETEHSRRVDRGEST